VIVNNFTNINKTNNKLSTQLIDDLRSNPPKPRTSKTGLGQVKLMKEFV